MSATAPTAPGAPPHTQAQAQAQAQAPAPSADPNHPISALRAALLALNQLDDLLLSPAYHENNTPQVTATINSYLGALKRAEGGRHMVEGEIPLELLDRMEREGLNPMVYTMEGLEKGVGEVQALNVREEIMEDIKKGIAEGRKMRKEEFKKGRGEEDASVAMEVVDS